MPITTARWVMSKRWSPSHRLDGVTATGSVADRSGLGTRRTYTDGRGLLHGHVEAIGALADDEHQLVDADHGMGRGHVHARTGRTRQTRRDEHDLGPQPRH